MNSEVLALREEYRALVLVADGLIAVLRAGAACNILTMARLADEARNAARKVASMIERLMRAAARPINRFVAALVMP